MDNLITATKVNVVRGKNHILKDVSLTIGTRDFTTIIGPNGAGKSMLLKCLLGLYPPDYGTVVKRPNLKIGYVPQRLVADKTMPMTVERFLTLGKKKDPKIFAKILEDTGIGSYIKKHLYILSGGEMQRVLLARALLHQPELLILDEPAQNLDIPGQLVFYKLLEEIYATRNISILMVSHDLHLVMASTKKVICLFHHICCSGTPQIVTKDPAFISLFGADMAQMMRVYNHHHDHHHHGEGAEDV